MAVVIGIAGAGDVEAILDVEQTLHRVGRGRIHADAAVPVDRHEAKRRVDPLADHRQVEPVTLGDPPPVVHFRAAKRIDADADLRGADRLHVDDVPEVGDVGIQVIVAAHRRRTQHLCVSDAPDALKSVLEKAVGGGLNPVGDVLTGRPAVWWVVFEAAIVGRVVRGRHDDAVGEPRTEPAASLGGSADKTNAVR